MAESKEQYKNLDHTLKQMRVQIIDSIPYAQNQCPKFNSPEEAFYWLKKRTTYKKDPHNIELFQTLPTLLNKNFHGVTGAGDCDCFTISILSLLRANNFSDCGIVLAGRNKYIPVHIYAYWVNEKGETKYLDLTNEYYDQTRPYNYLQHIPFKLNPLEEKKMFLQLADGMSKRAPSVKKQARQAYKGAKKEYKRASKLDYLAPVRAENQPEISKVVDDSYVWLPESNMHVRQDMFDDLEPGEFQNQMIEEGVPTGRIFELSKGRAERKKIKTEAKATKKTTKATSKGEKKTARANRERIGGEQKAGLINKLVDTGVKVAGAYTGKDFTPKESALPEEKSSPEAKEAPKKYKVLGMELSGTQLAVGGTVIVGTVIAIAVGMSKKK